MISSHEKVFRAVGARISDPLIRRSGDRTRALACSFQGRATDANDGRTLWALVIPPVSFQIRWLSRFASFLRFDETDPMEPPRPFGPDAKPTSLSEEDPLASR